MGGATTLAASMLVVIGNAVAISSPVAADGHTIYMVSSEPCAYQCAVVVMQVKGKKLRFKYSQMQAGGVQSIGWMRRRGDSVTGQVGGDCYKHVDTRSVAGRGRHTHFLGMVVTSAAEAKVFARRNCDLECGIPHWPWTSPKRWRAEYARLCE